MRFEEYTACDGLGLRALMEARQVSPAEVEAAARDALERTNAIVNGLADPLFDPPLRGADDGPLAGVPFLIKDIGPMAAGVPCYCGSRGVPGYRPDHDAHVMTRIRQAGLVTLGLTTMPEFGPGFITESARTGITRNPHDPSLGAGGSSGGSAALVGAGGVPMAHGSDGAGSLRIPAACCRVYGLKASRGRISPGPDAGEHVFGLTVQGGLTRTLRDTAALLDALAGPFPGDKYTAPPPERPFAEELGRDPGRLRVALWSPDEPATAAATALATAGHDVAEVAPPVDDDAVHTVLSAGRVASVAPLFTVPRQPPPHLLEDSTNANVALAKRMTALELMAAFDAQNRVSRAIGTFFTTFGLLVSPTLAIPPAPHGTVDGTDFAHSRFTAVFNLSGLPALTLPTGVQLVAPYGREDRLLRVAAQLEA